MRKQYQHDFSLLSKRKYVYRRSERLRRRRQLRSRRRRRSERQHLGRTRSAIVKAISQGINRGAVSATTVGCSEKKSMWGGWRVEANVKNK
jgi:hypothetical protein